MNIEVFNFFDLFVNQVFGGSIFGGLMGVALVLVLIGMVTKQSPALYMVIAMLFLYSMALIIYPIIALLISLFFFIYFGYNMMKFFNRRDDVA